MHNKRKISIAICCAALAALVSPLTAQACSISYSTERVGRTFRVKVIDRGRPVKALRLVLASADNSRISAPIYSVTDGDGYARFDDVSPGSFLLTPDHDAGVTDGVVVNVSLSGAAEATLTLKWPASDPLHVRSLTGTLRGPDFYPGRQQEPLSLSLLQGVSARLMATATTDRQGRFHFADAVPPGIYFLRLNLSGLRSQFGEGMIPIEVSDTAKQSGLDLDLGWSSCGLSYSEQRQYPEMTVSKLCGDIADTVGGAVSKAQIFLLQDGDEAKIVDQTQSGANGKFNLEEQHGGVYQLLVKSAGFSPFLRTTHVVPAEGADGCRRPIRIRLGVLQP
jgi:hypothetical protein